ncbi:marvel domain-containing protein [Aspergillus egyptiacus]|nr:marvel domain-containing protein [Aspergillus egyptiacus]
MAKFNFPLFYILRGVQALFAIIVLGLTGHAINKLDRSLPGSVGSPPDSVNFMLFNGVWSFFIVVPYFLLTPIFIPMLAHRYALPAVDGVTMIFWFAGFIALAVDLGDLDDGSGMFGFSCSDHSFCQGLQAAAAFGAFNWVLFLVTTVLNTIAALRKDPEPSPRPPAASVP